MTCIVTSIFVQFSPLHFPINAMEDSTMALHFSTSPARP